MLRSPEQRNAFLSTLDAIDRVLVIVARLFLGILIIAILAGAAAAVVFRPWGNGAQGEWFYFSVAFVLALGWAVGQFVALGHRLHHRGPPVSLTANHQEDCWSWELRPGVSERSPCEGAEAVDGSPAVLSHKFEVHLTSAARELLPNEDELAQIEAELASGMDLDDLCRSVRPDYMDWNVFKRWGYRLGVKNLLQERRRLEAARSEAGTI